LAGVFGFAGALVFALTAKPEGPETREASVA
jgi:hypothetical protein